MERYLRVNLLGPGPRLIKKNLPGRGLTNVEKHSSRANLPPPYSFKQGRSSLQGPIFRGATCEIK